VPVVPLFGCTNKPTEIKYMAKSALLFSFFSLYLNKS
jgi:hypothetical protein